MSTTPGDDPNRPAPVEPDWQVRTGLTLIEAEDLLDRLESAGVGERELLVDAGAFTVRWRRPTPPATP
jgi:hypothetical protein